MPLTVLFWNFNSQARGQEAIAARLALHHRADLFVLVDLIRCTGVHWKLNGCDHLPFVFRLQFPVESRHD